VNWLVWPGETEQSRPWHGKGHKSARPRWIEGADHLKPGKVTVLLADDHPEFPDMVEHLLEPEFEIVGKVADGRALFQEALRLRPEVVITDISMPVLNGIEAADRLKEIGCKSRIVFLTIHSDSDFVRKCLCAGALGYVLKSRLSSELVPAIHEAMGGHIFVSRDLPCEK
jgi:DNA-binding NarL/FixJ family response regulator